MAESPTSSDSNKTNLKSPTSTRRNIISRFHKNIQKKVTPNEIKMVSAVITWYAVIYRAAISMKIFFAGFF